MLMFETIFILLVIIGLGLWFFARPKFKTPQTVASDQRTYRQFEAARSVFVNTSEMAFYHTLRRDLPLEFHALTKVRLEDIIGVKTSIKDQEARWKLRARVKSRHVDFLVIDKIGAPLVAIELDGAVHKSPENFNADTLKNGLFKAAGIPLVRVETGDDYARRVQDVLQILRG